MQKILAHFRSKREKLKSAPPHEIMLQLLNVLAATTKRSGIAGAAGMSGVTLIAVATHVKQVRRFNYHPLFDRHFPVMRLTDAGDPGTLVGK